MKKTPLKYPKIADAAFKVRHRGEIDAAEDMDRYARGGLVPDRDGDTPGKSEEKNEAESLAKPPSAEGKINYVSRPDKGYGAVIIKNQGGVVGDEEPEERYDSVAQAVLARRKKAAAADTDDSGGEIEPDIFEEQNEAALKENLDSDLTDVTMGPDESEDEGLSRIEKIRRFAKSR